MDVIEEERYELDSRLRDAGEGVGMMATAVDVEAVAVAGLALGVSVTLSVVCLLSVGINSPDDTQDIGIIVIGSLDSVPERQRHIYNSNSQKPY